MASIFTYDPDPPGINSPWTAQEVENGDGSFFGSNGQVDGTEGSNGNANSEASSLPIIQSTSVTRLRAEPQEGPTEYKLHLLLRPRRSLSFSSTGIFVPGSHHSRSAASTPNSVSEASMSAWSLLAASSTSRQHRLEQLTTQLLWRLQQSSPYHSTSSTNLILPFLPEAKEQMQPPERPAKLLPGLEESRGALYEIGVSDDGALIGLTMDEMRESLNNLRAMAASLGCCMEVLRMIHVGDCEWLDSFSEASSEPKVQTGKLYVAEAYIKPDLRGGELNPNTRNTLQCSVSSNSKITPTLDSSGIVYTPSELVVEQLRVSFTGATTCGKSSLLGTLSTSTLDNGRGKSRLSLLKHRHEIASGITSSVVQELVGYCDVENGANASTNVINYATKNISSWTDIHAASSPGRLAVISDSAGHPRYRRTTVRGLIGWKPHWTFLCIAANVDSGSNDSSSISVTDEEENNLLRANSHISLAHLELCLKLNVPLAVIITKFDLATKSNFRPVLSLLLTRLKEAGKAPQVLANHGSSISEEDLHSISPKEVSDVSRITLMLKRRPAEIVPILFTSAINGTGITNLHALLRSLPLSNDQQSSQNRYGDVERASVETQRCLFHVEDLFNLPVSKLDVNGSYELANSHAGSVVGGRLATGSISAGDELWIGPFSDTAMNNPLNNPSGDLLNSTSEPSSGFLTPRSFTDALEKMNSSANLRSPQAENEWRRVKAVSLRNLRMPVLSLRADQVGTIGILPLSSLASQQSVSIRKGMVLISGKRPTSAHTFTADFHIDEASSIVVGTIVVIYCASVRASAKVVAVALQNSRSEESSPRGTESNMSDHELDFENEDDGLGVSFDFKMDCDYDSKLPYPLSEKNLSETDSQMPKSEQVLSESILVTFQLITYREWLEKGAKVFIMPGGGPGLRAGTERGVKGFGGLEGYVGHIVETFG